MTACDCTCACHQPMPESRGWAGKCDDCRAGKHVEDVDHIITLTHLGWEQGGGLRVECRCGWGDTYAGTHPAGQAIKEHRGANPLIAWPT